jgi:hypothetical protein
VVFCLYLGYVKVDSRLTFLCPFLAKRFDWLNRFTYFVLKRVIVTTHCTFKCALALCDFYNLGVLSSTLPAKRVRTLCIFWYAKFYDPIITTLFVANQRSTWKDAGYCYGEFCVFGSV